MAASVIGGIALALSLSGAGAAVAAGSHGATTSPVPTSMVKSYGAGTAHYCVEAYAPNHKASVRNERTGASASIRTDNRGRGCTDIPIAASCGESQLIVAVGVGADGNPGTSSAQVSLPAGSPACSGAGGDHGKVASAGPIRLTGANIALLSVGGLALAGIIAIGVVLVRRRRVTPAA